VHGPDGEYAADADARRCGEPAALNEAGEFLAAKREGAITDAHIQGEIGEILAGKVQGGGSPGEITVFKSLGLAVEDVAPPAG